MDQLKNILVDNISFSAVQKVLDSLPYYVLIVDQDHRIVLANQAVKQQLGPGKDIHSIIGGYCPQVIHDSHTTVPYCPLEKSVRENRAIELEFFEEKLGKWVCSTIYPIDSLTRDGKKLFYHTLQDIDNRKRTEAALLETISKFHGVIQSVIKAITITVEKRDPYTAGHQQRVSKLSGEIARELGLPQEQVLGITVAGLVHDIGKIAVPIEILSKPGRISDHEFHLIKAHSEIGYEILKEIEFPWPVAEIVLQHHERINGSGYPKGLKGEEIKLEALVLSVADVVEAMSSHRPYRQAFGMDYALNELEKQRGILYDSEVVAACLRVIQQGFKFE